MSSADAKSCDCQCGTSQTKTEVKIVPKSYIKLIVLLCSLVNSLIAAIYLSTENPDKSAYDDDPDKSAFVGTITAFIIFGVVYLITAIAYILVRNLQSDGKYLKVTWIVDIAYLFGGMFYYVGRNLLNLNQVPQDPFLYGVRAAAFFLLGMVVVFYRLIPFFIFKHYPVNLAKEHKTIEVWILAAKSLTWLVEFDAWYAVVGNAVVGYAIVGSNLQAYSSAAVWVLWALFILMYMVILYYLVNKKFDNNMSCVTSNIIVTVLGINFGLYLLSNTSFPLYRYYLHTIVVPIVWIVMKVLNLIVVIVTIALLMVYRCLPKTQRDEEQPLREN